MLWANERRDEVDASHILVLVYTPDVTRNSQWNNITAQRTQRDAEMFCHSNGIDEQYVVLAYAPNTNMEQYRLNEWLERRAAQLRQGSIDVHTQHFILDDIGRWQQTLQASGSHFTTDSRIADAVNRRAMDARRREILESRATHQGSHRTSQEQREEWVREYQGIMDEMRGTPRIDGREDRNTRRGRQRSGFWDAFPSNNAVDYAIAPIMGHLIADTADAMMNGIQNTINPPQSVDQQGDIEVQAQKVGTTAVVTNKPLIDKGRVMAGLLGIRLSDEDIKAMSALDTQAKINQYIVAKKAEPRPPVKLTEENRKLISRAYSVENSNDYKNLSKQVTNTKSAIDKLNRDIDSSYANLFKLQGELDLMLSNASENRQLVAEVEKILDTNWWELLHIDDEGITFSTADVLCQHPDIKNLNVNLGKMMATFYWRDAHVDVHAHRNNVVSGGYIHPHVNSGGTVCWGTGRDAYEAARKSGTLSTIFKVLRSIMTDYNPGSPYKRLIFFDLDTPAKKAQNFESKDKVFLPAKEHKPLIWSSGKYSDEFIEQKAHPKFGQVFKYQLFGKYYKGTEQRCNEDFYVKNPSAIDGYTSITYAAITDWSEG